MGAIGLAECKQSASRVQSSFHTTECKPVSTQSIEFEIRLSFFRGTISRNLRKASFIPTRGVEGVGHLLLGHLLVGQVLQWGLETFEIYTRRAPEKILQV